MMIIKSHQVRQAKMDDLPGFAIAYRMVYKPGQVALFGWWLNHPPEKYALVNGCQGGTLSQV